MTKFVRIFSGEENEIMRAIDAYAKKERLTPVQATTVPVVLDGFLDHLVTTVIFEEIPFME